MATIRRFLLLVLTLAIMVAFSNIRVAGQEKGKKAVVELTDDAGPNWLLKKVEVGGKVIADKGYLFTDLPEEIKGGLFLLRDSGDWHRVIPPGTVKANQDVTVYLLIRYKAFGTEEFGEAPFNRLTKEGWNEVKGKFDGTFNAGERWLWKVVKKNYQAGKLIIHFKTVELDKKAPVMFVFKPAVKPNADGGEKKSGNETSRITLPNKPAVAARVGGYRF